MHKFAALIATLVVFGGGASLAAATPADAPTLDQRVTRLEADVHGAYENTSYLTQHIVALQQKDAELEARIQALERKLKQRRR